MVIERGPGGLLQQRAWAVLRAPGVAVASRGRAGSLSRGRPASGPRAEWAGTTAPRSRGALRPAAPGAGGYKWSGGSLGRLSPPRVAAACSAFGLRSLRKKREKDKKNSKTLQNPEKKKRKRKSESPSENPRGSHFRTLPACPAPAAAALGVRRSPSTGPGVSRPPGPPRPPHARAPSPAPSPAHHVSALPFAARPGLAESAPTKIWFPSAPAVVILNRRSPRPIFIEKRVFPGPPWVASGRLLKDFYRSEGDSPFNFFPTLIF